jgi:hypothetical protein
MIVAIMQPYFFPYVGYFQLMRAVDTFVFYDDVQYMKGGWINRNKIAIDGRAIWLSMPVRHADLSLAINQRYYAEDSGNVPTIRRKLQAAYARMPAWGGVMDIIDELLAFPDRNIAAFNQCSLTSLAKKLGIDCEFVVSSSIQKTPGLRGEDRVIDICRRLGATSYVNAIGGTSLYDPIRFAASGLSLSFLHTTAKPVALDEGSQHLSIIDGLMREDFEGFRMRLTEYVLEPANAARTFA